MFTSALKKGRLVERDKQGQIEVATCFRLSMLFFRITRLLSCNPNRRFLNISALSRHATPSVSSPTAATRHTRCLTLPSQRNLGDGPDFKTFMPTKGIPPKRGIPNVKRVVAVSSAKGGVGKSTVAGTQYPTLGTLQGPLMTIWCICSRSQPCHVPCLAPYPSACRHPRPGHFWSLNTKAHGPRKCRRPLPFSWCVPPR